MHWHLFALYDAHHFRQHQAGLGKVPVFRRHRLEDPLHFLLSLLPLLIAGGRRYRLPEGPRLLLLSSLSSLSSLSRLGLRLLLLRMSDGARCRGGGGAGSSRPHALFRSRHPADGRDKGLQRVHRHGHGEHELVFGLRWKLDQLNLRKKMCAQVRHLFEAD